MMADKVEEKQKPITDDPKFIAWLENATASEIVALMNSAPSKTDLNVKGTTFHLGVQQLTATQVSALQWLIRRGSDGYFDKHGIANAKGETCPHVRSTWNALRDKGLIQFYNPTGKGYGRLRVVK